MKRTILAVLFFGSLAVGQEESAIKKYRNHTPQQIAEMSEDLRSSEVPMTYIFAAQNGMSFGSETLFGMYLNMLMYPGVHDYESAVRSYQEDLGDEPNGVLTVYQIAQLEKRAEMQKLATVFFPEQFSSYITEQVASVQGTFIILDDKIAYPINHAEVNCYKSDGYCEVLQMYLDVPDDNSWSQNYNVSKFDPEIYYVSNWTEDIIDAAPRHNADSCRTTTLNLNFTTTEFYQITRNTGRECEVMGQVIPALERPRISQIVNGEKIFAQEFADIKEAAFNVLASDFRHKIAKLMSEAENVAED